MRSFSKPNGFSKLTVESKIIYTAFCLFMMVGYASSAWLYSDGGLDATSKSARTYYLGANPAPSGSVEYAHLVPDPKQDARVGPVLDLPEEVPTVAKTDLRFAKPPRQVVETLHFHLFTIPVCLLILAHIFMMSRLPRPLKTAVIGLASISTLVHIISPPLIRFSDPSFSVLAFPSALVMGATWLLMTVGPVVEMWAPGPRKTNGA